MAMGFRYASGLAGFSSQCKAAFMYYEPVAYQASQYVLRTHGLEVLEMKKLKLEPYVLDTTLQIDADVAI
jgi:hypothetical protein